MSNTASKYLFCFNLLYFFDLLKNKTDRLPPSSDDTHHISCNNGQLRTSTVHFMGVGKGGQGSHGPPHEFSHTHFKTSRISKILPFLEANTDSICVGPAENFLPTLLVHLLRYDGAAQCSTYLRASDEPLPALRPVRNGYTFWSSLSSIACSIMSFIIGVQRDNWNFASLSRRSSFGAFLPCKMLKTHFFF